MKACSHLWTSYETVEVWMTKEDKTLYYQQKCIPNIKW